jgi:hypothetical protein
VRATGGTAVAVTDEVLLAALAQLARDEGHLDLPGGRRVLRRGVDPAARHGMTGLC